jgi:hypothetical protein
MALLRLLLVCLAAVTCPAQNAAPQAITADGIMARVAANQDRSEKLRAEYVYKQHIRVVTRRTNGKVMREETADYRVVPTPNGTNKELERLNGRHLFKGKYLTYTEEPPRTDEGVDGSLTRSVRSDLSNDKSKDGIGRKLFPLTTQQQEKYVFRLIGEETQQGRPVYRIGFGPKEKGLTWAGEAVIDKEDFQPVVVFTKLSRRIPFAIRTLLGTDLPGIGFNVKYQRQADGVWFPVSFGTEFRLHLLFFLNRDVSVALENTAFEHTKVNSTIKYEGPDK